ncbi:hypothetical protein SESBI_11430 [Sesbania bispinosa]|nr:hypothetical protein SESBI_11430 [Sesbania bispinosa]
MHHRDKTSTTGRGSKQLEQERSPCLMRYLAFIELELVGSFGLLLCWEKFGWTSQKADELLLPVLKEYNKHETQLRLEAFYNFNERFAKIRSKRIKKAVKGINGKQNLDLIDDSAENLSKSKKNKRGSSIESGDNKLETSKGSEESLEGRKK